MKVAGLDGLESERDPVFEKAQRSGWLNCRPQEILREHALWGSCSRESPVVSLDWPHGKTMFAGLEFLTGETAVESS